MAAPTREPARSIAGTTSPDGFKPGQRVWVHREGAWRPGIVLHGTAKAVTVRYRPAEGSGTGVDTVTGNSLAVRADDDAYIDQLMATEHAIQRRSA